MDCEKYSQRLMDAALDSGRRDAGLDAHVEVCTACRAELEAQRRLARALDQGLEAAVAGEPSAGFAARVRHRVAEEPAPSPSLWTLPWRMGWRAVAAGAVAVGALLAVWVLRQEPVGPIESPRPTEQAVNLAPTPPVVKVPEELRPTLQVRPRQGHSVVPAESQKLEIIVPEGQREALLQLYVALRSRRMNAAQLVMEDKPLEVAELRVPPLQVAELKTDSLDSAGSTRF